jgi:hypothetical protein
VSLEQWRKAMGYKEKPAAPKPPEPTPAPEPELEMDEATRAFDTGNTGPVDLAEQEDMEFIREAKERNPGAFEFGRLVGEAMHEHNKNRRAR